ncbi:MAG: hypothetical protein KDD75_08780, partial [Caldilineaceae bacterium]|nr:hypothetical protein [Caldilineaceae bacterium]
MDAIDAVATRVAVNRAKSRLTSKFAGAVSPVSGTVIGEGLALVNGQLVNAAVSESQIGETLSLQNAGRAAAAVYVPTAGAGGVAAASSGGGVVSVPAGGLIPHDLGGDFHIGQLRSDQAEWALMVDGSRMLMGDLAVYAGVMIDGVDLDVHAADPAAHHDPVTVGYGLERLGQQVSLSPSVAGGGLTYNAGVLSVGAGHGIQVNGDDVQLAPSAAGAGLAYDAGVLSVNVTGLGMGVANDAVTLTSSSDPGAAAAVLASDSAGWLNLQGLNAAVGLRSPYVSTFSGDLSLTPAADLVLSPASDLVHFPSDVVFRSEGYQSQVAGLEITAAGSGDFRYVFANELHAKSFIADLEQALAGGQIVSKSVAVVAESFTLPAGGGAVTVRFKDLPSAPNMAVFQSGDWVAFRSFSRSAGSLTVGWAWGQVTNYADGTGGNEGTQTWTWTRNVGTPGAATGTIAAEALALDFGVSGNGYYEVNSVDGQYAQNSPYWRIVTWA